MRAQRWSAAAPERVAARYYVAVMRLDWTPPGWANGKHPPTAEARSQQQSAEAMRTATTAAARATEPAAAVRPDNAAMPNAAAAVETIEGRNARLLQELEDLRDTRRKKQRKLADDQSAIRRQQQVKRPRPPSHVPSVPKARKGRTATQQATPPLSEEAQRLHQCPGSKDHHVCRTVIACQHESYSCQASC